MCQTEDGERYLVLQGVEQMQLTAIAEKAFFPQAWVQDMVPLANEISPGPSVITAPAA